MTKKSTLKIVPETLPNPDEPPRELGEHGAKFWRAVTTEVDVADTGGQQILLQCCLAVDRAESLRQQINRDGEVLYTKTGIKSHPALRDELACRAFITRAIARLGLDCEAIKPVGRPPGRF